MARRQKFAPLLLLSAIILHVLLVIAFGIKAEWEDLLTLVPFPLWCFCGIFITMVSLWGSYTWAGKLCFLVWFATLMQSDELAPLAQGTRESPNKAPILGEPTMSAKTLRFISFNTFHASADASAEVVAWQPDLVFFQESPWPNDLHPLARQLYGEHALVALREDCSILARGKSLQLVNFAWPTMPTLSSTSAMDVSSNGERIRAVCARLILLDGRPMDLINVHLISAEKSWQIWRPEIWARHASNNRDRRSQIGLILSSWQSAMVSLRAHAGPDVWPDAPCIFAGDMNTPAGNASLSQLSAAGFTDSYSVARQASNTYPNRFPVQRIDQCWISGPARALRHGSVISTHSDHRMVVVDILYP